MDQERQCSWISAAVAKLWGPAALRGLEPLKGDASGRRFWRVRLSTGGHRPSSAVAVDLGRDDFPLYVRALELVHDPVPQPPWLNIHGFLKQIGVAVPEIYVADTNARMLLVEDVGELPLFEAARAHNAADLYRLAVDELLIFHSRGTEQLTSECIASKIAYDRRLFRWELQEFVESGLTETTPDANRQGLAEELDQLATRLDAFPRVFSHRDYHGHNLFIQESPGGSPRIRVIDFQDALMAPAAQDLAVLLTTRDTSRVIAPRTERRLIDYYHASLLRRGAARLKYEDFLESYRYCVLQHALKVIGRFTALARRGRGEYRVYIPYALKQARRMLTPEFPVLHQVIDEFERATELRATEPTLG
jgi:aminoglycoside/choline kinase family phosphotransferase